ncbi:MAG: alpha-amylase [Desulfobacterales bacterium]|nr:alpha-amylase [Desulfobacterales bacterium]
MVNSIFEPDVQEVIKEARSGKTKQVTVDGDVVEIPTPFPSPQDWRDQLIYMIMIDRFNNPDAEPAHLPFDSRFGGFQGGKIKGITAKLGYLESLGVTSVWITPPLQNTQFSDGTYHGYGIQNFLTVDPRYGIEQELQELIDEAHARGMYVILDVVINHAGDVFEYVEHGAMAPFRNVPYDIRWRKGDGNPKDSWRVAPDDLRDDPDLTPRAACFPDELCDNRFFRRHGSNLSGVVGDFFSLKELKTDFSEVTAERGFFHPVRDIMIKAYQFAIAKFDFDGFRIDTLKHVERPFARIFCNAIREFALSIGKRNLFIYGEVADNDEKIAEYTGRFASDPDLLTGADAALDFPVFHLLPGVLKGFSAPSQLANLYEDRKEMHRGQRDSGRVLMSTHGEASRFFVTFLDNHDQNQRFRFSDPSDPNRFDAQVSMGVGCLFALQGVPVIYYGTEQGLHGAGNSDQDVREALWGKPNAFDTNNPFYRAIQEITAVYASQPALRYGRQFFRAISGNGTEFGISTTAPGIVAFSRILNDMEVVVVANTLIDRSFSGFVIVDFALNPPGTSLHLLYGNQEANATLPGSVTENPQGSVVVHRLRGGTTNGPVRALPFTLKPVEIQIIGKKGS